MHILQFRPVSMLRPVLGLCQCFVYVEGEKRFQKNFVCLYVYLWVLSCSLCEYVPRSWHRISLLVSDKRSDAIPLSRDHHLEKTIGPITLSLDTYISP